MYICGICVRLLRVITCQCTVRLLGDFVFGVGTSAFRFMRTCSLFHRFLFNFVQSFTNNSQLLQNSLIDKTLSISIGCFVSRSAGASHCKPIK